MRYILLSLAVAFLIIGIHQLMTVGIAACYPFIMLAVALTIATRLVIVNQTTKNKEGLKGSVKKK